jgi:hypothetical protein
MLLAEADQESRIAQELEMPGDAGLALRQHLANLAHGELPFGAHGENP